MTIRIDRLWKKDTYTISRVYIDNQRLGDGAAWCSCLEDVDRGLRKDMPLTELLRRKIYGQTAIPAGTYRVVMSYSPKFGRVMPEILDVPAFSGIRIHAGNTAKDTEGCLLFGVNSEVGKVLNSRYWTSLIEERIWQALHAGESIEIQIH